MITGTNHITFSVRELNSSIQFYRDFLGMKLHVCWGTGAYERTLSELRTKLDQAGIEEWKQNTSEGDSLYLLDPNGHRLELHCGTLATRLAELKKFPYKGLVWC